MFDCPGAPPPDPQSSGETSSSFMSSSPLASTASMLAPPCAFMRRHLARAFWNQTLNIRRVIAKILNTKWHMRTHMHWTRCKNVNSHQQRNNWLAFKVCLESLKWIWGRTVRKQLSHCIKNIWNFDLKSLGD